jgi:hypothetical protein
MGCADIGVERVRRAQPEAGDLLIFPNDTTEDCSVADGGLNAFGVPGRSRPKTGTVIPPIFTGASVAFLSAIVQSQSRSSLRYNP